MLKVRHLSRPGLDAADITVASGSCVVVAGASGSGKTLLLRAIADLDAASGELSLNGTHRSDITGPRWRRQVVYVAAEPGWWAPTPAGHFPDAIASSVIGDLLSRLGLDTAMINEPVDHLSTGERQRLALARALVLDPPVMLLDEPTASLDFDATLKVEAVLGEQMNKGTALVLVAHDGAQIERMGTLFHTIIKGHLGPPMDRRPEPAGAP